MLTEDERIEIKAIDSLAVQRLLAQYDELMEDPSPEFRQALKGTMRKLTKELNDINKEEGIEGELLTNDKGEAKLERIMAMFKEAPKMSAAVQPPKLKSDEGVDGKKPVALK